MKKIFTSTCCLFVFFAQAQITSSSAWTWIKGDSSYNQSGVYGSQGLSASANKPGAREKSMSWVDASGNFWLFGGIGYGNSVNGNLNDLWKYDAVTNEWTWIKGDSSTNQLGIYGIQGTSASANKPGGRESSVTWADAVGNLWLFGGNGYAVSGAALKLNDLWKYNITTNEWTWMKGGNVSAPASATLGVYGTQGTPNAANKPGARKNAMGWTDNSGNLWLFAGNGVGSVVGAGRMNDIWKYNPATNEWTWVKGDNTVNQPAAYGTKGISNAANKPGSRERYMGWADVSGNFWLFGGYGGDILNNPGVLSDLWKYDIVTNEWTWIKGDSACYQRGVYGAQGIANGSNNPGSREIGMMRTDASGNLWLFGGNGTDGNGFSGQLNDLWKYNIAADQWTWIKGENDTERWSVFGTLGIADPANKLGGRQTCAMWMDGGGNIWLLGGRGNYGSTPSEGSFADLWKLSVNLSTLPLHLLEFNGRLQNDIVFLNWKTENEQNVARFEIERSVDGRTYFSMGSVKAVNEPSVHQYAFSDNTISSVPAPVIYYRLKLVDNDKRFTYSRIIAFTADNGRTHILFYPNPVINEANLSVTTSKQDQIKVMVVDNAGRIIMKGQFNVIAGTTSLSLNVSGLAKGIYFIEIKGETLNEQRKFLKQ